jgi:hypothetical protein
MISSGYFAVDRETLKKLSKQEALKLIREMFNCGGRIGYNEYITWEKRINEGAL